VQTELDDVNPKFFAWAKDSGVNLDCEDDWHPWLECWINGYTSGVNDVKNILRGDSDKE
jgi:hypothetical protein